MLAAFAPRLTAAPVALPQMLAACEFRLGEPRQIVLVGDREGPDTRALLRVLNSRFVPHRIVLLVDSPETRDALAAAFQRSRPWSGWMAAPAHMSAGITPVNCPSTSLSDSPN